MQDWPHTQGTKICLIVFEGKCGSDMLLEVYV
jgi:hypothetical protein